MNMEVLRIRGKYEIWAKYDIQELNVVAGVKILGFTKRRTNCVFSLR